MIVVLDNYDSFTYNLAQYLGELGADVAVFRNDEVSCEDLFALSPSHIVISPGPGVPDQAGITIELIQQAAGRVPLLGVCLGHQAIGQAFGGRVVRARQVMHGKASRIRHDGLGVYQGIEGPFAATRYHSLAVEEETLPGCLSVTARAEDGEIMGLRHRELPLEGVQFHPEALLTEHGHKMLQNFVEGRRP
jgi:anthranilate synthase/aminodeoxychorismate synthase-like glutamine amidotransferase